MLILCLTISAQQKTAIYKDLSPNIFASYTQPIGIGILKFEGSIDLHTKLYEELKLQPGIHDKFTIFPYEVLEQQKSVLGIIGEIVSNDRTTMKLLRENLQIELVISGKNINSNEFVIEVYRTSDGLEIFSASYKNSTNSISIRDAVKLFSEKKETKYEDEVAYLVAVDEMPEPIGGIEELMSRVVYPELAKRAGIEGKV